MKKITKVLALMLALTMVLALCACGAKTETPAAGDTAAAEKTEAKETPKETVHLTFWGGINAEAMGKVVDKFNEEYKDKSIQISYERYVNDEQGNVKLETNLLAGSDIDVYVTHGLPRLQKRAGGMAMELSELCARDSFDMEAEFSNIYESALIDGKLYCIPTVNALYGIVINKTMFDEAGIAIPTKWTAEEFREIAKKLTHGEGDEKVYGMFFNTQQDMTYPLSYFSAQTLGNSWYNDDATATIFAAEDNVKAVKLVSDMMLVDGSAPTHSDSVTLKLNQEDMFLNGKAAMTIGPWMIGNIKNTTEYPHDFVTAFAPYPTVSEKDEYFAQGGVGDFICINPKSEHIEEAWEFIKWYSTGGLMSLVYSGRVPLNVNIDTDAILNEYLAGYEDLFDAESTKNVLIAPRSNYAYEIVTDKQPEISQILNEQLEAIYLGKISVEDGLTAAQEASNALLK